MILLLVYPWLYWYVKNPMNAVAQMMFVMLVVNLIGRWLIATASGGKSSIKGNWLAFSGILGLAAAGAILTHGTLLLSIPLLLGLMVVVGAWRRQYRPCLVAFVAAVVAASTVAP